MRSLGQNAGGGLLIKEGKTYNRTLRPFILQFFNLTKDMIQTGEGQITWTRCIFLGYFLFLLNMFFLCNC